MLEPYTEEQLFNLRTVEVEAGTEVDRFKCELFAVYEDGREQLVGKRKYKVREIKGEGYIGFDAYNHYVEYGITERVRITYIGKDYVCIFFRCPAQGNVPTLYRVSFKENGLVHEIDSGKGIKYRLVTTIKPKDYVD